jgi:hypothetical protein
VAEAKERLKATVAAVASFSAGILSAIGVYEALSLLKKK